MALLNLQTGTEPYRWVGTLMSQTSEINQIPVWRCKHTHVEFNDARLCAEKKLKKLVNKVK